LVTPAPSWSTHLSAPTAGDQAFHTWAFRDIW
jgi:hypothetical protein